jgi:hypothetical protein
LIKIIFTELLLFYLKRNLYYKTWQFRPVGGSSREIDKAPFMIFLHYNSSAAIVPYFGCDIFLLQL